MATLEESLNEYVGDELKSAEELESLKQEKRKKRYEAARRLAQAGEVAALLTGHTEAFEALREGAKTAKEGAEGNTDAVRGLGARMGGKYGAKYARQAANDWGKKKAANAGAEGAGKAADYASKMGAGSEAALAGAIAGALKGEGVKGIAASAWSWWILWFAFGFLTLSVILSPTLVTIITAIIALIYLDFHWVMSQFGFKFFGSLNLFQKIVLLFANLIVAIIPLMFFAVIYSGVVCGLSQTATLSAHILPFNIGPTVTAIRGDYCEGNDMFAGGLSGGAGASVNLGTLVDIPQKYVSMANFGDRVSDYPRVTETMLGIIERIFAGAQSQNINVVITSALRKPGAYHYSCHMLGEAVDFFLVPPVGNPRNPSETDAARIDKFISISRQAGAGFIQDEYRRPSDRATGEHIHVGVGTDPNCVGRQGETDILLEDGEYYMPY